MVWFQIGQIVTRSLAIICRRSAVPIERSRDEREVIKVDGVVDCF
jgi:hypothetical protein